MAELWDYLGTIYFAPVTEETFSIIEKLYDPASLRLTASDDFDPNDPEKLIRFFNQWVQNGASLADTEQLKGKPREMDVVFKHFALACKYYYPLLMANQHVFSNHQGMSCIRRQIQASLAAKTGSHLQRQEGTRDTRRRG